MSHSHSPPIHSPSGLPVTPPQTVDSDASTSASSGEGPSPTTPPRSGTPVSGSLNTPRHPKPGPSGDSTSNTFESRFQGAVAILWETTMMPNFAGLVEIHDFFDTYMEPAMSGRTRSTSETTTIEAIMARAAASLKAAKTDVEEAENEHATSTPLIAYLKQLVSAFDTSNRPVVRDTHSKRFKSLDGGHKTLPDITISRPGFPTNSNPTEWAHAGTVIELKYTTDIFDADGIHDSKESRDALVQLAKSARSLLMASGGCHVYVVACFNKGMARILRFDRAGFRATHPFNWLDEASTVFPTFFYRLYNPAGRPSCMDGDDDTIRAPTLQEKELMYAALCKHDDYATRYPTFEEAPQQSRCIQAVHFVTEDNKRVPKLVDCFTIGSDISYMDGLFGRATRVYRVILKEDFEKPEKPTIYALKDAWRQTCRRPELDFYDAIAAHCKAKGIDMDKEGMAQCHGSVDLSTWNTALHLTRSSKRGNSRLERRHTRTLLRPVGTPLKSFTSTKSLAEALRRVVLHHQIAHDAGVLHRDISDGNVLFGETVDGTRQAFLVDWDYAEFTEAGLRLFHEAFPEREEQTKLYQSIDKSLKDFTGTLPFVAIKMTQNMEEDVAEEETLHAAEHDLESVYWLLIWMILRHTRHGRREGNMACSKLFDENRKVEWFHRRQFTQTGPLFRLATDLGRQVKLQNPSYDSEVPEVRMTHVKVLETFDTHLKAADWPTNDPALLFQLPKIRSDKQEKAESLHQLVVKGASRASAKRSRPSGDDDEASPTVASASSHGTTAVSSRSDGPSASKKRKGKGKGQ